ncbi:MAG: hypothetical protein AABY44_05445 [Nitrospirota bacterium]
MEALSHLNPKARETIQKFSEEMRSVFGKNIISILLYGSAVGDNFDPERSDINFLIVFSKIDMDILRKYTGVSGKWQKKKVATPLILTEDYILNSADVFPIEFLELKENHVLLYGKNILKDLTVDLENLKLQVEEQLKGKLLHLRGGFLDSGERKGYLERLLTSSLIAFVPIFRNVLRLMEKGVPVSRGTLFRDFCSEVGLDERPFFRVWDIKGGKTKLIKEEVIELFGEYLSQIERLVEKVDSLILKGKVR